MFFERAAARGETSNSLSAAIVSAVSGPGWTRYSMVRLGWTTKDLARIWQHEIGHNLGAVQDSAPHSSLAGHCYESLDVMCYADGGQYFDDGGTFDQIYDK